MQRSEANRSQSDTLKWRWRYRTPSGASGPTIKAHGRFVTDRDPDRDGSYQILGIKGRRNGDRITGLVPAGTSIPGNSPYEGDNVVRRNRASKGEQLTTGGFQFSLKNGDYSNVFFANFLTPPTYLDFHSVSPFPDGAVEPNTETPVIFKAWIT